jgi:hypothetical protein
VSAKFGSAAWVSGALKSEQHKTRFRVFMSFRVAEYAGGIVEDSGALM